MSSGNCLSSCLIRQQLALKLSEQARANLFPACPRAVRDQRTDLLEGRPSAAAQRRETYLLIFRAHSCNPSRPLHVFSLRTHCPRGGLSPRCVRAGMVFCYLPARGGRKSSILLRYRVILLSEPRS